MARRSGGNQNVLMVVFIAAVVVIGGMFLLRGGQITQTAAAQVAGTEAAGVPVSSLDMTARNKFTFVAESTEDVELWQIGSDVSDPQDFGLLDVIDLTSGTATSTASREYLSSDNQNTKDLYYEGGSSDYDEKVGSWHISYDSQTGLGVLMLNGKDYIKVTDAGTYEDMDTAKTLGTSFSDAGTDSFNYNVSVGTATSSITWKIGNGEADAEIRQPVICIGDADGDLEGDELTGLTITRDSGQAVAQLDSINDIQQLFNDAAGTGGDRCVQFGDLIGESTTGDYEIEFQWAEANCASGEELEISFDDLGNANERQYPSGNQKVPKETVTINCIV